MFLTKNAFLGCLEPLLRIKNDLDLRLTSHEDRGRFGLSKSVGSK